MKSKRVTLLIIIAVVLLAMGASMLPGKVNPNPVDDTRLMRAVQQESDDQESDSSNVVLAFEPTLDIPPGCCPTSDWQPPKPPNWDYKPPTATPLPTIPANCTDFDGPPAVCDCELNGNCKPTPEPNFPPGYTP